MVDEFPAEQDKSERDPQGNGDEQAREQVGIFDPAQGFQCLEHVTAEAAQVIRNHDHREAFDRMLQNGLAAGRFVHAAQQFQYLVFQLQVLVLQLEFDLGADHRD